MAGPAVTLRELHRLWKHAKDIQTEIDRGPATLKVRQAKLAKQEEALRDFQESIRKLKVAVHEKEVTLKSKQQEIVKHEKQLNEATSKKEYDALKLEIANDKKACQQVEDDILEVMGDSEARAARFPELDKELQQAKQDVARLIDDIQTRRNELAERLSAVRKQVQEVEGALPVNVREHYERLTSARGEDALSFIQGRTCAACYTEITAQNYNELFQGLFVFCKSCGRLLYLKEQEENSSLTREGPTKPG